jgi:uncharacterized protein (DUF305 family)
MIMLNLRTLTRTTATTLAALAGGLVLAMSPGASVASQADATPETRTCADVSATPGDTMAGMDHGDMNASTPMAGMGQVEFDLMYIDMMIPHHESIIALASVAVNELSDPRLVAIAEDIIATQSAENEQMRQLREAWYPGAEPVSMEQMMTMPGMSDDMAAMDQQMSAEYQVQAFCAAEDKDLAFIEQVIPHHQMAIDTSQAALEHAVHPELVTIAEDVIAAQEVEIAELEAIHTELTGEATPAS